MCEKQKKGQINRNRVSKREMNEWQSTMRECFCQTLKQSVMPYLTRHANASSPAQREVYSSTVSHQLTVHHHLISHGPQWHLTAHQYSSSSEFVGTKHHRARVLACQVVDMTWTCSPKSFDVVKVSFTEFRKKVLCYFFPSVSHFPSCPCSIPNLYSQWYFMLHISSNNVALRFCNITVGVLNFCT